MRPATIRTIALAGALVAGGTCGALAQQAGDIAAPATSGKSSTVGGGAEAPATQAAPPAASTNGGNTAAPETSGKPAALAGTGGIPSIESSLGRYGDPGGIRAFLDSKGIDYNFTYIGEVLGNVSGGVKQGATYEGRLDGQLDVDLEKLAGISGTAIHANFYQIHGRGLSGNNTLDLFTVSGIEAFPSTKLYEAYIEKKFDDGKIFIRAGQLAADTEFFVSQTATLFVSSTFGFPAILANDLPDGGPAYPLATPGVRLKIVPTDTAQFLVAVFNGDPAGPFTGFNAFLPQVRDLNGTLFRVQDSPLLMAESSYAYNSEKDAKGLPGTIKFGYLHSFESFAGNDPGFVNITHRGNDGVYGIIDQTIYNEPGGEAGQGAAVFVRAAGMPGDRNLFSVYVDAGLAYKGLIPGRPDDTAGISGAYTMVSPEFVSNNTITGGGPIHVNQALFEATYQYVVLPGFSLQPDFQYVYHPGVSGVAGTASGPLPSAAIFGLRATVHY